MWKIDAGIIVALITAASAVIVAVVGARGTTSNRELIARLTKLEEQHHADALVSARTDLIFALNVAPDDTVEIMKIARHYFVELRGNGYASLPMARWATERGINISSLYANTNDLEILMNRAQQADEANRTTRAFGETGRSERNST